MDENLLQHRTTGRVPEAEFVTNNDADTPDTEQDVEQQPPQFRDLVPAPLQPPLRMKFDPPIEYDGKVYSEIVCDFEKLLGVDFIRAEREFRAQFKPVTKNEIPFAQMNPDYHVILISRASNLPQGLIKKLPGRYWTTLQTEALKACGSSAEEEKA